MQKAFDKIQRHFMIKVLRNLIIEGMYFNIMKTIYDKCVTNITLNGENLKPFPPLLFSIVLEFQARAIRQEEVIKRIQIGEETVKVYLFADDMTLYLKHPKNSTPKFLDIINSFSNIAGYKICSQNQ
jgi:hypothetical protein